MKVVWVGVSGEKKDMAWFLLFHQDTKEVSLLLWRSLLKPTYSLHEPPTEAAWTPVSLTPA